MVSAARFALLLGGLLAVSVPGWAQLPHYALQSRINSCGAAALAAVLQSYGYASIDEHRLWGWAQQDYQQRLLTVPDSGLSLADLKRLSQRVGLSVRGVKVPMAAAGSLPTPAIVRLSRGTQPHFVVLWQVRGRTAQVFDPAVGNRWVATARLMGQMQAENSLSALIVAAPTLD